MRKVHTPIAVNSIPNRIEMVNEGHRKSKNDMK